MDSGVIRFILLREIGQAFVDRTVTREEMAEALELILRVKIHLKAKRRAAASMINHTGRL